MYILEDESKILSIQIKKSNYISIVSDDSNFSKKLLEGFYYYFSEKKLINEEKILIYNYHTGEKEQKSSKFPIYIEDHDIDFEVELGSKTVLYQRLLKYLKEKFPIEPVFITLNSLVNNFFLEDDFEKFKENLSLYSKYSIKFQCSPFSPMDI